jgi:Na+-driven multidrug efflux pump
MNSTIKMLLDLLSIGVPIIISFFLSIFVEVINLAFIGKQGNPAMISGVGMANMYINVTAIGILFGLNTVLSTYVS